MTTAVLLALLIGGSAQAPAARAASPCAPDRAPLRLLPVDEAATRPDFFLFRARLQAAIARRDEAAVLAVADPGIRLSFGGDEGLDALRAMLRDPEGTVWVDLGTALAMGGAFTESRFEAPYVFARWPDRADSFECAVVIGERVRVRAAAAPDAVVVASLSYELVQIVHPDPEPGWRRVRLADGRSGFMSTAFLRSPIDRRAIFQLSAGQWRLTAFVAGD